MKLKLPSGTTGFYNDRNEWQCTGSQTGRQNRIPSDQSPGNLPRLRLQRLPFVDGDYDRWGAYWGGPATVWIAWTNDGVAFGDSLQRIECFVRANNRTEAKVAVLKSLPAAKFYR